MGLDSYLERMPRYGNTTPSEIRAIESYMDWRRQKENKTYNGTMEKWCGISYSKVPKGKALKFYKEHCKFGYAYWDAEKKYSGRYRIIEEIGYWRKVNQIHNWFVENVQNGVDDCDYHNEVTKEDLEELLDICQRVIDSCELVKGKIKNGETLKNGKWVPIMEDGLYVKDSSVAEELLPCCEGFFFGSYNYDQYYVDDIKKTIDIITTVLETTDFETQMIYYVSSW